MRLEDISNDYTFENLQNTLRTRFNYQLNTQGLTVEKAQNMLNSMNESLNKFRDNVGRNTAEQNPEFLKRLMVSEALELFIAEKAQSPYAIGMAQAMRSTGDKPPLKKSTISKAHKIAKAVMKDDINEDVDTGEAEVVLATKDFSDRLNGMVEDIGEMLNEDLYPLTDSMRDQLGSEVAETYAAKAQEILNQALADITAARDGMVEATAIATGESTGEPMGIEEPQPELDTDVDLDVDADTDLDVDAELDIEPEEDELLGREKQ